jgi:hypothetical protein
VAPSPAPGDDAETCTAVMASGKVIAEAIPAIQSGACGIAHPVTLKAIVLADKRQIKLEPPVAMRCRIAGALADWVIEDVAPVVAAAGQPLAALSGVGAYECRGRNRVAGAKLSEHASGNAVDIGGLKLADSRVITVQQQPGTQPLLEKVRATACARFSTVLGPGSDGYHNTHVHLDLEERRHSSKLCQWDFPPPPSAAPTPPASSPAQNAPDPPEKKK